MPVRLRLQIRRLRMRMYNTDQYYETYYYESVPPRVKRCHRLRRPAFSRPALHRRYTFPPSSTTSDTDPEDLYWIQSPRNRARTFTPRGRSDFITVDMDPHRPRSFWRSLFGLEYFDVYQRLKRATRTRTREESSRPRQTPKPRSPRDRYYTRPVNPGSNWDDPRWEGPRINPPRRAPSPLRARPPHRRSDSLRRRDTRDISPEPHVPRLSYDRPRYDTRRPREPEREPIRAIPRTRRTRPSSPITEREPPRPGRYTSPGPSSRPSIIIIQPTPRAVSPQRTRVTTPSHPRPPNAEIITHNSFRERMSRRRIRYPESTPARSRKVRFREGHEEIPGRVWFHSDSDSSSDSDSNSDSDHVGRPGPSRVNTHSRSRLGPRYGPVVVNQIIERGPGGSQGSGERGRLSTGDVRRGSLQEDVRYVVREPRDSGRRRDYRRHI